jgi:aspartate aminotransferase
MIKVAKVISDLPVSPTLKANDLVHTKRAQDEVVCHMGFGEAPFPVPDRLQKALGSAAYRKEYLKVDGLPELTEAIKSYYRPLLGDEYIDQTDVMIAPGSKLILYALQMAVDGDLLMPVPSWVSYEPQSRMLHNETIKIETALNDDGYHIQASNLSATIHQARKDGLNPSKLLLNAPSNPTGLIIPDDELKKMADICREENILIISDEIYGLVSFDRSYSSISQYAPEITSVTSGVSKHLSLGGWRLGFGFIPKKVDGLHGAMRSIASEVWSCVASPIQDACVEAYKRHDDIEEHIKQCSEIHAFINGYIADAFRELGVKAPKVQGAFYNYPDFAPYKDALAQSGIKTSQDLYDTLLQEYNLVTLPAVSFGEEDDVLALRISGCDYDGKAALEAYQGGAKLDQSFVETYTPNVKLSMEIFARFLSEKAGRDT